MKIDQDYLRKMLEAFQSVGRPFTNVIELKEYGLECSEDRFLFHLQLLADQGLLVPADGGKDLGFEIQQNGLVIWRQVYLRLTSKGHDFIAALSHEEVWELIKRNFKEEGISTLVKMAINLAENLAKQKVKQFLL